jgi:hypothetical protein
MKFTFAITTDYSNWEQLEEVYRSIINLNIPEYEVLTIGPGERTYNNENFRFIDFDESQKERWVTRKKNILCQEAKYNNIVLMHDYYVFDENWYNSYLKFGEDWDVCSNAQLLQNGKRHFTDWVLWDYPILPRYTSIPYDEWTLSQYMYMSGGYMLVKKALMLDFPFNESLTWGQADDVEWSFSVRGRTTWKCNGNAIVRHNKKHRDCDE